MVTMPATTGTGPARSLMHVAESSTARSRVSVTAWPLTATLETFPSAFSTHAVKSPVSGVELPSSGSS